MNNNQNFLVIGGDSRQIFMADYLIKKGYNTYIYALPENKENSFESLKIAIKESDIIVLPLPVTKDNKRICSINPIKETIDDISALISNKIIFGGIINKGTEAKLRKNNNLVYDYFKREDVTMLNAIPTAQGILKAMTDNINYTIHSSECAIFGFGRTAKITAQVLKAIGAHITVCVRKPGDIAAAKAFGYNACYIADFHLIAHKFDVIINTVPAVIIKRGILSELKAECLIIDVSSAPFGVDFACAHELGIKAIQCPSLPGKVAPKTAGEIIAKGIINTLKEDLSE